MNRKEQRLINLIDNLRRHGITLEDAAALRRIQMTLRRWDELECGDGNGCIERDDATGKPFWLNSHTMRRTPIPDREGGALKRLAAIMARYPQLWAYHQSDPRGCALYIGSREQLAAFADRVGAESVSIASCYSSIGVAVCE